MDSYARSEEPRFGETLCPTFDYGKQRENGPSYPKNLVKTWLAMR